jgi:hypothetical protein
MKKFLVMGALALALTTVSRQEASAWWKFSIGGGFNISWECACNHHCAHCNSWWGDGPCPEGLGGYPLDDAYTAFGAYTGYPFDDHVAQLAPTPVGNPAPYQDEARANWYGNPAYRAAAYNATTPSSYTPAASYYPGYSWGYQYPGAYGAFQAPSYWYGY